MKPNNLIKRNQLPAIIAASQTPTPRPPHLIRQRLRRCFCASWILLLLLTPPAVVQAQFTYVTNNGAITITGYTGLGGAVTIPAETNGLPVTSIGDYAFLFCISMTGVTIPDSVTNIGTFAFYSCPSLTGVFFKGNAPTIDSSVFASDSNATVYYLPGTTNWGPTFAGPPTVLWNPQVQVGDATFGVRTNRFGFTITGTTSIPIVVEACTNLATRTWSPLQTNALMGDTLYFSDPNWANYPSRFYRIRSP